MVIVMMGVSGCGKTTVGKLVAGHFGWPFYDADDYHPQANVDKMRRGEPLTDQDRWPWLDTLRALIAHSLDDGRDAVLACSALRRAYRDRLRPDEAPSSGPCGLNFVYLRISPEVSRERISSRPHHFMPASLVASQFADLEPPSGTAPFQPDYAVDIDADQPVAAVVTRIAEAVERLKQLPA